MDIPNTIKSLLLSAIEWLVNNRELLAKNPDKDFTRIRKFGAFNLIHYILTQTAESLPKDLYTYCRLNGILSRPTKAAVIQQRRRFKDNAFKTLFYKFNSLCKDLKTLFGYHVYAFDGTSINIAKNPDSPSYFEKQDYNQLLAVALYDVLNHTYQNFEVETKPKSYEVEMAVRILERMAFPEKTIILADRYYPSNNFIEHLNRKGVKYVLRSKSSNTFREINNLPDEELDVDLHHQVRTTQTKEDLEAFKRGEAAYITPYSRMNKERSHWDFEDVCDIRYRCVKIRIKKSLITLITNLPREEFPPKVLAELYRLRWEIETSYRDLKYSIGLTNLHAKREDYIYQEICAKFLMYNFCQRIAREVEIPVNPGLKHQRKVNLTVAMRITKDFFREVKCKIETILDDIMRETESYKPDAEDTRKKVKPKSFIPFIYRVA